MINPIALKILQPVIRCRTRRASAPAADQQLPAPRRRARSTARTTTSRSTSTAPRAPDLGQVQLHGRGRRRPDQLPRSRSERHGRRRVHEGLSGDRRSDVDAVADAADGHDVRVRAAESGRCSARTSTPATSASTCSASPAPTTRASATSAMPAIRSLQHRLQRARQPRRLEPDLPRRADVFAGDEPHEGQGPPRLPRRLLRELPVPRSLAAGNRQPARQLRLHGNTTALRGGQTAELLQRVRGVPARPVGERQQERAERADDRARVAARAVLPRSLDAHAQADARPRPAVGVLPDHAPRRRARPRSARSRHRSKSILVAGAAATRRTTG